MSIRIIRSLYPCTLQDMGRPGFRAFGVPLSGPMDPLSYGLANLLCGNISGAVALEITLHGLLLLFEEDALVALSGGGSVPTVDGRPVGCFRPLFVRRGALMEFTPSPVGCRMYLAMAGGFKAEQCMGSAATYVPAAIGGLEGRPLKKADLLFRNDRPGLLSDRIRNTLDTSADRHASASWGSHPFPFLFERNAELRFLAGPEWADFSRKSQENLESESFQLTDKSDRMGFQLRGPVLTYLPSGEMISSAVCPGTVQVTHAGIPVILMADGQTTGGYPRIAQVISADLPRCGQCRPGDALGFRQVTISEALELHRRQTQELDCVERSIRMRFGF